MYHTKSLTQYFSTINHEKYPSFHQNKNMNNKHRTRIQPHYSEYEDYSSQNHQRFSTNQQNNNWNVDQPGPIYQPDFF